MKRSAASRAALLCAGLLGLVLCSCRAPVRINTVLLPEEHPLESRSAQAEALLQRTGTAEAFEANPLATLTELDALPREPETLFPVVELAFLKAEELRGENPALAETLYLWAVVGAHDFLRLYPQDPTYGDEVRDTYNWSLGRYLTLLQVREAYPPKAHQVGLPRGTVSIEIDTGRAGSEAPGIGPVWQTDYFDQLLLAGELGFEGLKNRFTLPGVGATLIGYRENQDREAIERFYPPEGIVRPITAVLHLEPAPEAGAVRPGRLVFYNPLEVTTIPWNGRREPLAADFTAPLGFLVAHTDLQRVGMLAVRNADKLDRQAGVFLLQPYDPERIPVLMIHGLLSSPMAWRELTNELMADPEIRRRYQVWHYFYPSALPYLYSGQRLESHLEELYTFLRQTAPAPALDRMVIVSHSMGGLLARTLVSHSGDAVWNRAATVPPEELQGSAEDIALIREIFHFVPKPFVKRVIFLATPHRGSKMAGSIVGRMSASLVNLPDDYEALFRRVTEANLSVMTPEMRDVLAAGGPTSIQAMAPEHPMIQALSELPFAEGVKVHSIIGSKKRGLRLRRSSDGVVPFWSAHLPQADTELIVASGHGVHSHPVAIEEVRRILLEHLQAEVVASPPAAVPAGTTPIVGNPTKDRHSSDMDAPRELEERPSLPVLTPGDTLLPL